MTEKEENGKKRFLRVGGGQREALHAGGIPGRGVRAGGNEQNERCENDGAQGTDAGMVREAHRLPGRLL